MARPPSLCGVILAAGESSRMGRDKALLPWPPQQPDKTPALTGTFLSGAIQLLETQTEMIFVVAGNNAAIVAPVVYSAGASLVVNPAPERGQFSSLQVGLKEVLNHGRDAAMVTLVDRPPASDVTAQQLAAAFASRKPGKWAVVPQHGEKHGHPFIIAREMIEAFLRAPAASNAQDVEHQNQEHIQYVVVDDPNVALNVDTPEDYARLTIA
jgi:molybdenum cofactor cytidylyltransferase